MQFFPIQTLLNKSEHLSRKLAKEYGILVGISSGANFLAAKQMKGKYQNVVTVFPDRGERYLSTKKF